MDYLPLLTLIIAFLVLAAFAVRGLGVKLDGTGYAALLITVFAIYWVEAGKLSKFGVGGVSATFRTVAQAPVKLVSEPLNGDIVLDEEAEDFIQAAFWEKCETYFVLRAKDKARDSTSHLDFASVFAQAVRPSLLCGAFAGIIVLDKDNHYIGTFDAAFFSETRSLWLAMDDNGAIQPDLLRKTIFFTALRYPRKRIEAGEGFVAAISETASLEDAQARFADIPHDVLAVTNELGQFRGIIRRDRVAAKLLSALANDGK